MIYPSTETLTLYKEKTATGRPYVPLEGKVEIYMQTVLDEKRSIFETVKRNLVRYRQF